MINISAIIEKIKICDSEIISLENSINEIMDALNSGSVSYTTSSSSTRVIGIPIPNTPYVLSKFGDSFYKIIKPHNIKPSRNAINSVEDLVAFIKKYQIYQFNNKKYDNACLAIAKAYGRALVYGDNVLRKIDDFHGGAYRFYDGGKASTDKNEILQIVHEEISHGRPCVVEVTTQEGHRHYVTVVGMKQHVSSASELKEEDLLIIDPFEGQLEAMDDSDKYNRHLRYSNGGDYVGYRVDVLKNQYAAAIEEHERKNTPQEENTVMAQNDNFTPNQQDLQANEDKQGIIASANNNPTSIETKYGEVKMEEIRR